MYNVFYLQFVIEIVFCDNNDEVVYDSIGDNKRLLVVRGVGRVDYKFFFRI